MAYYALGVGTPLRYALGGTGGSSPLGGTGGSLLDLISRLGLATWHSLLSDACADLFPRSDLLPMAYYDTIALLT